MDGWMDGWMESKEWISRTASELHPLELDDRS